MRGINKHYPFAFEPHVTPSPTKARVIACIYILAVAACCVVAFIAAHG